MSSAFRSPITYISSAGRLLFLDKFYLPIGLTFGLACVSRNCDWLAVAPRIDAICCFCGICDILTFTFVVKFCIRSETLHYDAATSTPAFSTPAFSVAPRLFTRLFVRFFLGGGWVLQIVYSQDARTDFDAKCVKRRGSTQGCAFWGSQLNKKQSLI